MYRARYRIGNAFLMAFANAAVAAVPPVAVELFGHTLRYMGVGLQRTGHVVERLGENTVSWAEEQKERSSFMTNQQAGPSMITVGGVKYRRSY